MSTPDKLVPDPEVCREFGVTPMTVHRWDHDPELAELGWPPKVKIRKRNFRSRRLLDTFKEKLLRKALNERKLERDV